MWTKTGWFFTYLIEAKNLEKSSNNEAITEDKVKLKWWTVLEPPFSFDLLVKVFETNFIANKAADIFAKKVAYTWFDIVRDWEEDDDETLEAKMQKARDFFDNINPEVTFEDLIYAAAIDYKITWNCAIEVARWILSKEPNALYHIPISTARVLRWNKENNFRTGQRFAQVYDTKYEDYIIYNKYYPNPDDRTEDNGFWEDLNEDDGLPTHEMIWIKNANPWNIFYWYSPSFTVTRSYLIKKYIDDSHIQEFENSFLNRFAIVLEEWTLTKESVSALQEYLAAIKDDQDWTAIPVIHNPSWRVRIEKLWESIRDWWYLQLLDKVNQEIIVAFWVPPILLWITENSTQANQTAQEKKFYYEEILPAQNMFCKIFTRMMQEDFGWSWIKLAPKVLNFKDRAAEIEVVIKGIEKWLFSVNRGRALMWESPLLDDNWEELAWASESYIYIAWKPVPVADLIKFTWDTATQINLENLLKQANEAWDSLAKWAAINKEIENSKIDYDKI